MFSGPCSVRLWARQKCLSGGHLTCLFQYPPRLEEGGGLGAGELRVGRSSSLSRFQFPFLPGREKVDSIAGCLTRRVLCVLACLHCSEWEWRGPALNGGLWMGLGFVEVSWIGGLEGRPAEVFLQVGPEVSCQTQPSWQHCAFRGLGTSFSFVSLE